jgi:hypothetical protein
MTIALFSNPGQNITLAVEVLDGYGARSDGYVDSAPQIDYLISPSLQQAVGYPMVLDKLSTGVYYKILTLPQGIIGSYLASVSWINSDGFPKYELFLINVSKPFGNSIAIPG